MAGHIRRQGKGSWEIKYELPRCSATGKRRSRHVTFRGTKREAQVELRRLLHEQDQGVHVEPHKLTVAEYLEHWLETYARPNVAPTTCQRWASMIRVHLAPAFRTVLLKDLSPIDVQSHYTRALASGRHDGTGGLSAQTVKHHHRLLSQALKQAVRWRLLSRNPASDVKAPSPEYREIEFLDKQELTIFLKSAQGSRNYAPILLAATTGMRRGEILGLRWKDVDLNRATLTVNQSLEQTRAGGLRFKPPKTKRGRRSLILPQLTVEALQLHRIWQMEERLLLGLGRHAADLVFAGLDGGPIRPDTFSKAFERLVALSGVRRITLHGLRHTHISHLLMDGVHVKVVSERAGHASVSVTLDRYAHVIPTMQEDAAALVDQHLREALHEQS